MQIQINKKNNTIYIVSIIFLLSCLVSFIVLYSISAGKNAEYADSLENIYQKNYYSLVDNINNTEIKLAKTLSATDSLMQAKYLEETSDNAKLAETNFNNLPYNIGGLENSLGFINQVSGYTQTLSNNLRNGNKLSNIDKQTLESIYDRVLYMKNSLTDVNQTMFDGFNITKSSLKKNNEGINEFSNQLQTIKDVDVEYPTMIYDGPFSNSVINKEVKGLDFNEVDEEKAKETILNILSDIEYEDIESKGLSTSRFETYNFEVRNKGYIQITKKGGKLLTYTANKDNIGRNISIDNAKEIAINFCRKSGIENCEVVWFDVLKDNVYINVAPVNKGIVYYPDLVKVKVDLNSGEVIGYEASEYYTNHTTRNLMEVNISKETAKKKIPLKFNIQNQRLALIPLEFNREVLCWEYFCVLGQDEYYFYFNVTDGGEENILKVIKTNDGNKLM